MIAAHDIAVEYGDVRALDGVSFRAGAGEIVGIVGPGGSGKSVLLKSLCGLVVPSEGHVEVGGERLDRLDEIGLARVRSRFGVLFQNNALFDFMSVQDNVGFPLARQRLLSADQIADRAKSRLEEVDLGHALALLPNELSGGMKKRVSLARATIAEPAILLYDDPTAGLDPVTSSKIFRLIRELARPENTAVVVSHDVDRMRPVCHRYALLFDGAVRFTGTWQDAEQSADHVVRTFFGGGRTRRART